MTTFLPKGPVTEVKTDIFVTSFGPVSDVEMVCTLTLCFSVYILGRKQVLSELRVIFSRVCVCACLCVCIKFNILLQIQPSIHYFQHLAMQDVISAAQYFNLVDNPSYNPPHSHHTVEAYKRRRWCVVADVFFYHPETGLAESFLSVALGRLFLDHVNLHFNCHFTCSLQQEAKNIALPFNFQTFSLYPDRSTLWTCSFAKPGSTSDSSLKAPLRSCDSTT